MLEKLRKLKKNWDSIKQLTRGECAILGQGRPEAIAKFLLFQNSKTKELIDSRENRELMTPQKNAAFWLTSSADAADQLTLFFHLGVFPTHMMRDKAMSGDLQNI